MIRGSCASSRALFALLAFAGPMAACHADLTTPNGNPTGAAIAYTTGTSGGSASLGPPAAGFVTYAGDMYLDGALAKEGFTPAKGWNFVNGTMTGHIQLDSYYAWADKIGDVKDGAVTAVGYDTGKTGGGAVIALTYIPMGTDPKGDNIHWVQVIRTNVPSTFGSANGQTKPGDPGFTYYIDNGYNAPTVPADPYYDSGYAADHVNFIDNPSRSYASGAIWNAEVFLVSDATAVVDGKTVHTETVLGGVYWGFSTAIPEPSSVILTAIALGSVALAGLRREAKARRLAA